MPPVIVDLYDMDVQTVGKDKTDFLARAVLGPMDIDPYSEGDGVPTPRWYPLKYSAESPESGEILMSFALVNESYPFKTHAN